MKFTLSEDQEAIRQAAAELANNKLAPRAAQYDESEEFTWESVKDLAALGFLGMTVPEEYGGVGADYVSYALAMEEVSRGCAATSVTMTVQNSLVNWPIMTAGNEEQKRKYLPKLASGEWLGCYGLSEPAVGSDPAGMATTATLDGDEWVLNGSKNFISNGGVADVAVIWATTDRSVRHKAVATFVVEKDTPGFTAGKSEHKLGIHGSNTVMLYFDNCRIPKANMLATPGEGFKLAMMTLDGGRIGVAAQAVGIAQAALDYAANYAHQRTAFGKPIADLQAIQFKIADMATRVTAARLLTLQAADLKERHLPYSEQAAMAKLFASETATFVTHQAVQILGGYGYLREYPVERLYRDARITEIYEGTSEIQRLVISSHELKARRPKTELLKQRRISPDAQTYHATLSAAEVFGYPPDNLSPAAQNVRLHKWCPFNNPSGADCTKDKRDDPLGVCSIVSGNDHVITCPVRFREDYKILDDAAAFFFPNFDPARPPRMLSEVSLPDKNGKSAGNIDIVLAMLDEDGYIVDYGAVEIQAVYISGNVRGVFRDYMANQADYLSHWRTDDYPRPDYLSSSRKRLAPQLLFKGSILNQWGRKMAVAVQRSFFRTLPTLQPVSPEQAQVAWLIYDLELDPSENRYHLVRTDTVYTEFKPALDAITTPEVGTEQDFIRKLQARVVPKKAAPDTTKIAGLSPAEE